MRLGHNPQKNKPQQQSNYHHQVVMPVYIPNAEGYFRDSFKILQRCLDSLFKTCHHQTFITVVNNGSALFIKEYLDFLLASQKIHELIHTENIGKLNAILKGIVGNNIPLVTIADADVLFLPNWQNKTLKVFKALPKVGVVGIVPQFKMYECHCGNILLSTLFDPRCRFIPVKNPEALINFYVSLGWVSDYNEDYLKSNLAINVKENLSVLVGSGHFVATYKKDIFEQVQSFNPYKMGGNSEGYLDQLLLQKDYWRLTTQDNYAYHMGNVFENWMEEIDFSAAINKFEPVEIFTQKKINKLSYFIKNRLFVKIFSSSFTNKIFLRMKKLPPSFIEKY